MKAQPTLPISGRRKVWRALPSALVLICMIVASPSLCAASGVWSVEHAASRVGFVTSFGGVRVAGDFPRWDAQIRFDPRDLSRASVVAVLDMRAVRTGNPDQEQALPTAVFFDGSLDGQPAHVAHVENPGGGPHSGLLLAYARVLKGHLPAGKVGHSGARLQMLVEERGALR